MRPRADRLLGTALVGTECFGYAARDTNGMSAPVVRRTPLHHAIVAATQRLTPRMRRVTLRVPSLQPPRPAQDVELVLRDDAGRRVKRRYTIRHHRADVGEIDIDALLHGQGPGAVWAAGAQPGDEIEFFGPRGRLEVRAADWHLFVGDESALPAFAALAEAVEESGSAAFALIEVGDASDELPVRAEVRWLHRGGAVAAGTPGLLGPAVDEFSTPGGSGHAYLLGESRVVAALRPRLWARGLSNEQIYVKGYWNVGRTGKRAHSPA